MHQPFISTYLINILHENVFVERNRHLCWILRYSPIVTSRTICEIWCIVIDVFNGQGKARVRVYEIWLLTPHFICLGDMQSLRIKMVKDLIELILENLAVIFCKRFAKPDKTWDPWPIQVSRAIVRINIFA